MTGGLQPAMRLRQRRREPTGRELSEQRRNDQASRLELASPGDGNQCRVSSADRQGHRRTEDFEQVRDGCNHRWIGDRRQLRDSSRLWRRNSDSCFGERVGFFGHQSDCRRRVSRLRQLPGNRLRGWGWARRSSAFEQRLRPQRKWGSLDHWNRRGNWDESRAGFRTALRDQHQPCRCRIRLDLCRRLLRFGLPSAGQSR